MPNQSKFQKELASPSNPFKHSKRCAKCSLYIPSWEIHQLCHKHKRRCHSRDVCRLCKHWGSSEWSRSELYYDKIRTTPKKGAQQQGTSTPQSQSRHINDNESVAIVKDNSERENTTCSSPPNKGSVSNPTGPEEGTGFISCDVGQMKSPSQITPSLPSKILGIRRQNQRDIDKLKSKDKKKKKSKHRRVEDVQDDDNDQVIISKSMLGQYLTQLGYPVPTQETNIVSSMGPQSIHHTPKGCPSNIPSVETQDSVNTCTNQWFPLQPTFDVENTEQECVIPRRVGTCSPVSSVLQL